MGVTLSFAAVAVIGTAFMLRFLLALLRECKAPRFLRTIRLRKNSERSVVLSGTLHLSDPQTVELVPSNHHGQCVKTKSGEERQSSGLVPLDLKSISGPDWLVPSKSRQVFHKHRC